MSTVSTKLHILIAGGGPAGSSLAIRLKKLGHAVTLIEKEKFPRHKLCGEFISPECLVHFDELGVKTPMLASGGASIAETVFYEIGGRGVAVPSEWFGHAGQALSLSRARMDEILLRKAEAAGTKIFEGTAVVGLKTENGEIAAVKAKSASGETLEVAADIGGSALHCVVRFEIEHHRQRLDDRSLALLRAA